MTSLQHKKRERGNDKGMNTDGGEGSISSLPTDDLKAREFSSLTFLRISFHKIALP